MGNTQTWENSLTAIPVTFLFSLPKLSTSQRSGPAISGKEYENTDFNLINIVKVENCSGAV